MKLVSRKNDCVCASSSLGCGCHWPSVRRHLSVVLTPSITLIVYCVDGVHNSPYFLAVWLFGRVDGTRCTHKETRRSKTTGMNVKQQLQQQSTRNRGVRVKSKHVHVSIKGPEKKEEKSMTNQFSCSSPHTSQNAGTNRYPLAHLSTSIVACSL